MSISTKIWMVLLLQLFVGCGTKQNEPTKITDSQEVMTVQILSNLTFTGAMYVETNVNTSAWYMQQHPEVVKIHE